MQIEVDMAKLEGLEATRSMINLWNNHHEYEWGLMPVSKETADKLVTGEFMTFNEFRNSADENSLRFDSKIEILYREIYNQNKKDYVYVIETIFINE